MALSRQFAPLKIYVFLITMTQVTDFINQAFTSIQPGKKRTQAGDSVPVSFNPSAQIATNLLEQSIAGGYNSWIFNENGEEVLVFLEIRNHTPPHMEIGYENDGITLGVSVRIGRPDNGMADWDCMVPEASFIPMYTMHPEHGCKFGNDHDGLRLIRDASQASELIMKLIGEVKFMGRLRHDSVNPEGSYLPYVGLNYECILGDDSQNVEYYESAGDIIPELYKGHGVPRYSFSLCNGRE